MQKHSLGWILVSPRIFDDIIIKNLTMSFIFLKYLYEVLRNDLHELDQRFKSFTQKSPSIFYALERRGRLFVLFFSYVLTQLIKFENFNSFVWGGSCTSKCIHRGLNTGGQSGYTVGNLEYTSHSTNGFRWNLNIFWMYSCESIWICMYHFLRAHVEHFWTTIATWPLDMFRIQETESLSMRSRRTNPNQILMYGNKQIKSYIFWSFWIQVTILSPVSEPRFRFQMFNFYHKKTSNNTVPATIF